MNLYQQYMYSYPHKTAYRTLEQVSLEEYVPYLFQQENSLYVHIPFCESKCGYCNLFSVAGQGNDLIDQYLDAMERQTEQWSQLFSKFALAKKTEIAFVELILGGGTPLYLSVSQLERVFSFVEKLGFSGESIVVETSPRQTTLEKLQFLKKKGVTRISMGVQSMHQKELQTLHRKHLPQDVRNAMEYVTQIGFPCVNLDVIYGIPEQTKDTLKATLDQVLSYDVDEIFLYPLYIKRGTWLYREGKKQSEHTEQLYRFSSAYLQEHGYSNVSMRRFVKGKTTYNGKSCGFENTLALGCGGRSYLGPLHFCTPYQILQKDCLNQLQNYIDSTDYLEVQHGFLLSEEEEKRRFAMKNLLFASGLDSTEYRNRFGNELCADFPIIKGWARKGYVIERNSKFYFTKEGMIRSDYLGPMFISEDVKEKMEQFWKTSF